MSRTRLNWVVGGGIGALLFVAGVDAFRSSDSETSAPTATAATTTINGGSALPACTRQQIAVSTDVQRFAQPSSGRIAMIEVRSLHDSSCRLAGLLAGLTIKDRAGNATFQAGPGSRLSGAVLPASGPTEPFPIPSDLPLCGQGGPYLVLATLGPYSARRSLPGWRIGCPSVPASVKRLRAKYIARADAICRAATARFHTAEAEVGTEIAWSKEAAQASEKALAKLRALPPPQVDRARVNQVLALMERQTDVLRQEASAGDTGPSEYIRARHHKDELVYRLASLWGVSPDPLWGCPVALPA
jgi:hypothetical protein